jgi:hypothetical protein
MNRWPTIALLIVLFAVRGSADTPATQPDADDPPVAAALAPSYIAIGRELSLRLSLVRRTLHDLTLDPAVRTQALNLIDSCRKEVNDLISQMRDGPMPPSREVLGVPANLRACRQELYQLIGPDQSKSLDEMLRSLRGEARSTLGHVRLMLDDLNAPPGERQHIEGILSAAEAGAESLPHTDLPDGQYDSQRKRLDGMLAKVRTQLMSVLTPAQLARLGPKFEQVLPPAP